MKTEDGSPVSRVSNANLEQKCRGCQMAYPRMYSYYGETWCTAPGKLCRTKAAEAKEAKNAPTDEAATPPEGSYSGEITKKILAGRS